MKNYSPESILINKDDDRLEIQAKRDKREENSKYLVVAYKKAVELLDEERIDPNKFKGLYSNTMLGDDYDYVKQRQQKFKASDSPEKKEAQEYAAVFEAIIHDQVDMNGWAGEHATAQKASWYDDLKNGIDEIIEFEQTETSSTSHLALGADITFGTGVIDKMNDIKFRIDRGDIGVIKYLLTDTYRGEMSNVPRVIIGVDMKNLNEIIKLWVDNKKKDLAQHRVKFMILSQIMVQLNDFSEYAEKVGKIAIANSYNRVLKIVESIWDEESKKYTGDIGSSNFEDDRVYSAIRNYCDNLIK